MEWYLAIIAVLLIIGVFPIIGRKIYPLSEKKLLSIYLIGVGGLFAISAAFSGSFNPSQTIQILSIYWDLTSSLEFTFFIMIIFYLIGGLGLIGSLAEKSSEIIEDVNLFSDLKKRTTPKAFIMYMIYGYLFVFAVFALNKVLLILLGMEFKPAFTWFEDIFRVLQFDSTYIVVLGITLFSIKAFKFGYFSKEFWKANLTYNQTRNTWYRYFRKFFVVFFYCWGVYIAFMISFIDIFQLTTPIEYGGVDTLHLVFYIASIIEAIYFFTHKTDLVNPLKTQKEDFKQKIDDSIIIEEEEVKKSEFDDDIKFE